MDSGRDVWQALDGTSGVGTQGSLLQVLRRQLVQQVLLALQDLQEGQVRLGPVVDDGAGALAEDMPASV